ncbi:phosphopantetheine--protein transferase [Streptomyces spiroverticillatus]|uniref:Phosphopantetheine--protein transferase n=1 Tax=Streptomyces finlayi TaxID=67296 RepID=A0A919CEP1_9ACTN|nr:ParA family protein [Streptomyces finlayi]GHA45870.1 phosphopantetheine--protein transferase [Streptomyces spiroverticillatus]GHD15921.1 phosphopantetheine--protein transferase [Streptomyces finlayi]
MSIPSPRGDREKLITALTPQLRRLLKIRAFEHGMDIQDAAEHAIKAWYDVQEPPEVATDGAKTWGTFLPPGEPEQFKDTCNARNVTYVQGLAQAITMWLEAHPSPSAPLTAQPVTRVIVANQKGGVGKTFISSGIAQALAEAGKRVLIVDYDPQGHLTSELGFEDLMYEEDVETLLMHMEGTAKDDIHDLLVALDQERFGERLHLLPASDDAFLRDVSLSKVSFSEAALERALEPLEADYDVIVIDGPPSLGLNMDTALYYVRRREGELADRSGIITPVWANKASHRAFKLLSKQKDDLCHKGRITIDYLGLVVNAYDSRRGKLVSQNKDQWERSSSPSVLAVIGDLKEGREASDGEIPLLEYAPDSEHANAMRDLAKELAV